jgi:hypothetical protein
MPIATAAVISPQIAPVRALGLAVPGLGTVPLVPLVMQVKSAPGRDSLHDLRYWQG